MKPRLQITATIDTAAHADQMVNALRNRLAGKNIFEEHALTRTTDIEGRPVLIFDIRFGAAIDRDDVWTFIRNQAQGPARDWILNISVARHECTHDDAAGTPCRVTELWSWSA